MAITVNSPLRIKRLEDYHGAAMYMTSGTPVDCVKLAMHTIVDRKPDLMISGINHGSNAAVNVVYSGTMGAAFEACACGLKAIGLSLTDHSENADFSACIPFVRHLVSEALHRDFPAGLCLNVNFPATISIKGMRLTKAAHGRWTDEYERYSDPHGNEFYWLTGKFINSEPENEDTDEWCLAHGIASAVPSALDRTACDISVFNWASLEA